MIDEARFRADYPAFQNAVIWPPDSIAYWLQFTSLLMNQARWGAAAAVGAPLTLYDVGQELFVAHHLVVERSAQEDVAVGGLPGWSKGAISGESIDKVSVNYEVNGALVPEAGHWNLTTYGTRFLQLMRMVGAGPVQVGIPCGLGAVSAYTGPPTGPGWPV